MNIQYSCLRTPHFDNVNQLTYPELFVAAINTLMDQPGYFAIEGKSLTTIHVPILPDEMETEDNEADVFTKNTSEATYLKQTSKFMTEEEEDPKIIGKGVKEQ